MNDQTTQLGWLENHQAYTLDLYLITLCGLTHILILYSEDRTETKTAFQEFASWHLSSETRLRLVYASNTNDVKYTTFDEKSLKLWLEKRSPSRFNFFFINRFLVKQNEVVPSDAAKLRVSPVALDSLAGHINVAPAFILALSRYHLPTGKGQRIWLNEQITCQYDFWYSIPVRVQVKCTEPRLRHASSTGGSNQMDPFHYLHLADHDTDIRGAKIFLYFSHRPSSKSTSVIAINMLDGRWPKTVEEPQKRIRGILNNTDRANLSDDACFIHLVYFTIILKWWTNALESVDSQLISYERELQDGVHHGSDQAFHEELNKALHAMAAHLHRYGSELKSLHETLPDIEAYHESVNSLGVPSDVFQSQRAKNGLRQIASQLQPVRHFEAELEKKLQNILALLFNRIQLGNDRAMVANSAAMQAILKATQEETKVSQVMAKRAHELTEEMKKDSLSMKTVAVLTMFFLPGTAFAALLSMPFFTQIPWIDNISRFWIWFALTIPSTGLVFAFYIYWKRRGELKSKQQLSREEGVELHKD